MIQPAPRLSLFLSSTIEDFRPVREQICAKLSRDGINVYISDASDFPVAPGATSHDSCLATVQAADVFVLLVGQRFGGKYRDQNNSITWREWQEARQSRSIIIVLIERNANDLAKEIAKIRRAILQENPLLATSQVDAQLHEKYPDAKPLRSNLPAVQRFIDELRKGHIDNWVYDDWDGTVSDALKHIRSRLCAALNYWHPKRTGIAELVDREGNRLEALNYVTKVVTVERASLLAGKKTVSAATQTILDLCALRRADLFGCQPRDIHNIMLYQLEGDQLIPGLRASHPSIKSRYRRWNIGQSQVGAAAQKRGILVSGDVQNTDTWVTQPESADSDRINYVSVITVPLYVDETSPLSVLTITSSRLDHFAKPNQPEVKVAEVIGSMLLGLSLTPAPYASQASPEIVPARPV